MVLGPCRLKRDISNLRYRDEYLTNKVGFLGFSR
jgi:hypothetical protein